MVTGRAGAPVAEVIGALAAADEAPNETGRLLSVRYPAPAGWTIRRRVPFSSARKWSGAAFDGHGTWLLGAPSVLAGAGMPAEVAAAVREHEAAGRRVLLLASSEQSLNADGALDGAKPPAGAEPAALIALAEELRQDAAASVRYLLEEGIKDRVRGHCLPSRRSGGSWPCSCRRPGRSPPRRAWYWPPSSRSPRGGGCHGPASRPHRREPPHPLAGIASLLGR